ncbi:hypothetical protein CS063_05895 [Sporanaerobium hydrogeniformans]|uniref:Uncharacterized protein n=1 Tax=Sporanaerobium hydrogeniformans TaxID=3072179 RepID=A0AC61DDG0_9FIRM|nr:hypothetical protein [Sporanaerobium hydrogeniformans]PHV71221.1 hypothetical protein CS063_05895 [Sporanaerobium hydrogeniformans]
MMHIITSVVNSYHLMESREPVKKAIEKQSFDTVLDEKLKVVQKVEGSRGLRLLDTSKGRETNTKIITNEDGTKVMLVIQEGIIVSQIILTNSLSEEVKQNVNKSKALKAYGLTEN